MSKIIEFIKKLVNMIKKLLFILYPSGKGLSIATNSLSEATGGATYSANLEATGGSGENPVYTWSATGLPTGLSVSTDGTLSGLPIVIGTFEITVTVTDQSNRMSSKVLELVVVAPALSIATTSLNDATFGSSYSMTLASSGGYGNKTWSATGLPEGLSMSSSGTISGTATDVDEIGSVEVEISVTDSFGTQASKILELAVVAPAIDIVTLTIATATEGYAYSQTFTASGGYGTMTWSATGLPTGLSMGLAGTISGSTTVVGTSIITVKVIDSLGTYRSKNFSLTVVSATPYTVVCTDSSTCATAGYPLNSGTNATGLTLSSYYNEWSYTLGGGGIYGVIMQNGGTNLMFGDPTGSFWMVVTTASDTSMKIVAQIEGSQPYFIVSTGPSQSNLTQIAKWRFSSQFAFYLTVIA